MISRHPTFNGDVAGILIFRPLKGEGIFFMVYIEARGEPEYGGGCGGSGSDDGTARLDF